MGWVGNIFSHFKILNHNLLIFFFIQGKSIGLSVSYNVTLQNSGFLFFFHSKESNNEQKMMKTQNPINSKEVRSRSIKIYCRL